MDEVLISVIIPAYNAEDHIGRCLESVINQTYRNLEIIVVNDGSTDHTSDIVKSYMHDDRIVLVDKENEGPAKSRNIGLEKSHGEYIGFVDSDDYVEPEMYDKLFSNANMLEAEISVCRYVKEPPRKQNFVENSNNTIIIQYTSKEYAKKILSGEFFTSIWNKLFRRECAMVVFNDLYYGEDACYLFEALSRSNSVVCMNYVGYHYVENENSLITREFNLTQLEEMRFADLEKNTAKKWFPACEDYVYSYQFIRNIGLLTRMEMKSYGGGISLHNEKEECIENIKHAFSKSKKQVIPKGKVLMWRIYRINKKLFRYLAHVYYKYKSHRKIYYGY